MSLDEFRPGLIEDKYNSTNLGRFKLNSAVTSKKLRMLYSSIHKPFSTPIKH